MTKGFIGEGKSLNSNTNVNLNANSVIGNNVSSSSNDK